jgi:hypothetical protein
MSIRIRFLEKLDTRTRTRIRDEYTSMYSITR